MGGHDLMVPVLAAELFSEKMAPIMICSGGFGKITRRIWKRGEGQTFARKCIKLGVPKKKILIEKKASNMGENFAFSKKLLVRNNIETKTGIIVCKPHMARRALATARKQWPEIEWRVAVKKIQMEDYISKKDLKREINVMVGDVERLKSYAEAGFQVPVKIPDEVWDAHIRLAKAGFNRFL
jgi:uncharacterized SAM-binding protein YcdF (DUF218 family)